MTNEHNTAESSPHEPIPEDWLSAYVDNELTAEQRQQVEQWLATDPKAQATVAELQRARKLVAQLPPWPSDTKPIVWPSSVRDDSLDAAESSADDHATGPTAPSPTSWRTPGPSSMPTAALLKARRQKRLWAFLAVAAAVLLAVGIGITWIPTWSPSYQTARQENAQPSSGDLPNVALEEHQSADGSPYARPFIDAPPDSVGNEPAVPRSPSSPPGDSSSARLSASASGSMDAAFPEQSAEGAQFGSLAEITASSDHGTSPAQTPLPLSQELGRDAGLAAAPPSAATAAQAKAGGSVERRSRATQAAPSRAERSPAAESLPSNTATPSSGISSRARGATELRPPPPTPALTSNIRIFVNSQWSEEERRAALMEVSQLYGRPILTTEGTASRRDQKAADSPQSDYGDESTASALNAAITPIAILAVKETDMDSVLTTIQNRYPDLQQDVATFGPLQLVSPSAPSDALPDEAADEPHASSAMPPENRLPKIILLLVSQQQAHEIFELLTPSNNVDDPPEPPEKSGSPAAANAPWIVLAEPVDQAKNHQRWIVLIEANQ
ncbi:MAG: hypothetical protein KatS3mg111_0890 [Pirellulaceae bacterium]|nr:MAG: hypothetical protein KatS3mg111_0890 [Pirellulaceae bacterium]